MKITETFADGTVVERDATKAEIEQREKDLAEIAAQEKAKEAKELKRQAALAKLADLGLELEDLKALGLG